MPRPKRKRRALRRVALAAQNAMELVRAGRLTSPYGAPFEVVFEDEIHKLRRYRLEGEPERDSLRAPLLLIPPLMVASEVYDIDPELSAVGWLMRQGIDVWIVDYGAPERQKGGMSRTLDDHVRAANAAVDFMCQETGCGVHVAGYSQGGMFAYQTAAYRRSEGVASLITFGSPVDLYRSMPGVADDLAERLIAVANSVASIPLERLEGVPGKITSSGFKLLSVRKEVGQFFDFVRKLHDRHALEQRESKRLFLRGEGFVAWPGPALRKFVDEFIVANRMTSGGFVIDGQTVTLADVSCPILYFVGERDEMARPASVRAIREAAPNAEAHEVRVKAGHFGLVVGSAAMQVSWPTVAAWMRWREGEGPLPATLLPPDVGDKFDPELDDPEAAFEVDLDTELVYDVVTKGLDAAWNWLGDTTRDLAKTLDNMRWQVPRLSRLRSIRRETHVSAGRALAEQARAIPEQTFFLWKGRAFSYADADRRVNAVVRGLIDCGVRPRQRVGVLMGGRPSFLSVATALSRLGSVAVLLSPDADPELLERAIALGRVSALVADPENAQRGREAFDGGVFVLGGGGEARTLPKGVVDMEAIDPDAVEVPDWHEPNPGRARDLSMVILTVDRTGEPRAAHITNHRWAFSAIGSAAACTLTPRDTVYCGLPLHHAAGTLVATGAALVGGSRLALASQFSPETFWDEVHRYGATVVFYAGAMCRALVNAPYAAAEKNHPVRLFAGSGMRADVWRRLVDRFGPVGVLEFYASTEGNAVLANASGEKVGALGRPLPGSAEISLVAYDFESGEYVRDADGHYVQCDEDEPGVLIARVDRTPPRETERLRRGVFEDDDTWFFSGDLLRRDADGDYWFVDRLENMISTESGPVSTVSIEDALHKVDEVELAVAYGVELDDGPREAPVATILLRKGDSLDADRLLRVVDAELDPNARPRYIRCSSHVSMTDGFRPLKTPLRRLGIEPREGDVVLAYERGYRFE